MTFLAHLIRPYTGLDLTEMGFLEEYHTQTTLTDTAAHAEGQFTVKKFLVEIQLGTILLTGDLQLTGQTLLIHTDTHGR